MPTGSSNKWSARVLPRFCCFSKQGQNEASKADDDEDLRNSLLHSKKTAIAFLGHLNNGTQNGDGIGIVVKNNLVLTSHGTIPSVDSAKEGEMTINCPAGRGGCCPTPTTLKHKLLPRKYFITSRAMDMTVVACEDVNLDLSSTTCFNAESVKPESKVYLLGAHQRSAKSLKTGVARVAASNGSIVEFSAGTETWLPGSAGFNSKGEFAFMVCEPKRYICQADRRQPSSSLTVPKQAAVLVEEVTSWLYDHLPAGNDDDQGAATSASLDEAKKPIPWRPSSAPAAAAASKFCLKKHRHVDHQEFENEPFPDTETEVEAKLRLHMPSAPPPVASAASSPQSPQSPCSPRSTGPALKLRDPAISLSPKSMATPTRCLSPNPRLPGVSYSVSPSSRSLRSARSRRSSPRSSRHSKRSPSCCLASSVGATRYGDDDDGMLQQKFQQFLNSPEYEPPLCPADMSSSDDDTPRQQPSASRGRSRSAADTKKHLFGGPVRRATSDDSGASDAEVYMGVGYLKHTQVSKGKSSKKKDLPGFTVWHH